MPHRLKWRAALMAVAIIASLVGCDRRPVPKSTVENDQSPPVNEPQPNPIVKPTNEITVPLTNVPITTTTNK
ncbi:MAG TPA: hypothetical protein VK530_04270 [Candidatus Acidoferrum sp.]|nr:hypothetical protein [Candidatus Acidoferrum sp.]